MPRFTKNGDVVTVPDVLAKRYEANGWQEMTSPAKPRPLSDYTKSELQALAQDRDVDLSDCKTKKDMIDRLTAPLRE